MGLLTAHAELWQRAWCNQLWWAWVDDGRVPPRVASPRRASAAAVAGGWAASGGGTMGDADQVALAHSQGVPVRRRLRLGRRGRPSWVEDVAPSSDDDDDEELDQSGDELDDDVVLSVDIDGAIATTSATNATAAATTTAALLELRRWMLPLQSASQLCRR